MSASNRKNRSFRVENLEDRKMFAADLGGAAADLAAGPTEIPAQVADQTPAVSSTTLGDIVCLRGNNPKLPGILQIEEGVRFNGPSTENDPASKMHLEDVMITVQDAEDTIGQISMSGLRQMQGAANAADQVFESLGQSGQRAIDGNFVSGANGLSSMGEGESCGVFMDKGMSKGGNGLISMSEGESCGV